MATLTTDEILETLRQVIAGNQEFTTWTVSTPHIVALVKRYVEAEREACAKVCDELSKKHSWEGCYANECAEAIRARGTNE